MAVIRETLVLEDRFSAVFSSYLNLGRQIAANMRAATDAQSGFAAAAAESGAALGEMAGAGDRAAQSAEETAGALTAAGLDIQARWEDNGWHAILCR